MLDRMVTDKARNYILYGLIALLALFAGQSIFNIMGERTLGSIVRHNIRTITVAVLISAFYNENFITSILNFENFKGFKSISRVQLWVCITLGILLGIMVFSYAEVSIIYWGIMFFILLSLVLSVYFIFTERSFYSLCLFWCAYPFVYFMQTDVGKLGFEKPAFDNLGVPFSAVYIIILFICIVLASLKEKDFLRGKSLRFVCWLILLSIPSIFFSVNSMKSAIFFFFDMIIPAMFFIIIMITIREKEQIERLLKFMLFSLSTFMFIAFYFYRPGEAHQSAFNLYEAKNILISPGSLAILATIMLPFSALLYLSTRNKAYLVLSLAFPVLIILSNFRSVFLGLVITVALLLVFSKTNAVRKIFYITAIFLTAVIALLFIFYFDVKPEIRHRIVSTIKQFQEYIPLNEISSGRIEIWDSAVRMIHDHPVMGIGAGMWQDYAFLYKSKEYTGYRPGYGSYFYYSLDAHNFFLDMYLKYGVFTLVIFSYFIFYLVKKAFLLYKESLVDRSKQLSAGFFISFIAWLIISTFDYRFYEYDSGMLLLGYFFWALMGLLLKSIEIYEKAP